MKSLLTFFKNPAGRFLLVAIGWQLAFTILGLLLSQGQGVFSHMNHWDAGWYHLIINEHYTITSSPASPAFYPLFPLLVGTLSLGFIDTTLIALLLNTASLWLALLALYKILKHYKLSPQATTAALFTFLCFPSAFFMHVFYSEALFIALAFWSYYFALKQKWWAVGTLLAFLTAARLPSVLFILLAGLEYLRSYNWNIKKSLNKNLLWFLLTPLGFIAYGLYLYIMRGDFLAMFHAYSATNDWTYQHFSLNIFPTIWTATATGVTGLTGLGAYEHFINSFLPILAIVTIVAASTYLFVRLKSRAVPLFVFCLASIPLFTINSNVVSVHRYALPIIGIYIAVAFFYKKGVRALAIYTACALMLIVQLFLFAKFAAGVFAG